MRNWIDRIVRVLLIILLASLVIDVVWQVFTRYVLEAPSTFTDELARYLLIWVSLLGGAYYSGQNEHIRIDLVTKKLSPGTQRTLSLITNLLIIVFVGTVFIYGGGYMVYITWIYPQFTPALQLPMSVVYAIGPISGLLIVYYKMDDMIRDLRSNIPSRMPASPQQNRNITS